MEWFWITLIFLGMTETLIVGCIVIYYGKKILQQNHKEEHREEQKCSCDNCELVRSAFRKGRAEAFEVANGFLHKWGNETNRREKELFNKLCEKNNITKINDADFINMNVVLDVIKEHAQKYGFIVDLEGKDE